MFTSNIEVGGTGGHQAVRTSRVRDKENSVLKICNIYSAHSTLRAACYSACPCLWAGGSALPLRRRCGTSEPRIFGSGKVDTIGASFWDY